MLDTKFNVMSRFRLKRDDLLKDVDRPRTIHHPLLARHISSPGSVQDRETTADSSTLTSTRSEQTISHEPVRVQSQPAQFVAWTPVEVIRTSPVTVSITRKHDLIPKMVSKEDNDSTLRKALIISPQYVRNLSLEPVSDEEYGEELFVEPVFHPKRDLPPQSSPFTREILSDLDESPFDRPVFGSLGPRELSFCLEDAYCPIIEVLKSLSLRLTNTDVIVCSPMRTGQTPVLKMVSCLLRQDLAPFLDNEFLLDHVGFPGTKLPHIAAEEVAPGRRLLKTHVNLRCFVRAEAPNPNGPKMKLTWRTKTVIIPLRDPCRVLESWFRHVSGIYESMEGKSFPFGQSDFKSFCPGGFNPAHYQEGEDYERFIANALAVAHLPNVCIVFYEDVLANPEKVMEKLATFLGVSDAKKTISRAGRLLRDEYVMDGLVRLEPVFSDEFLLHRDRKWCDFVQYRGSMFESALLNWNGGRAKGLRSYYDLYERMEGRNYPVAKFIRSANASKPRLSDLIFFKSSSS